MYGILIIGVLYLLAMLTIGAVAFDYALYALVGQDVSFWADMLAAVIVGSVTTPLAAVLWVLSLAGLTFPLF